MVYAPCIKSFYCLQLGLSIKAQASVEYPDLVELSAPNVVKSYPAKPPAYYEKLETINERTLPGTKYSG